MYQVGPPVVSLRDRRILVLRFHLQSPDERLREMPTPLETLERLATAFTVRDIMTPTTDLVCAPDEVQAILVSDGNPDFDVIPIKQNGKLTGYFERSFRGAKKIAPSDLISDGTSPPRSRRAS